MRVSTRSEVRRVEVSNRQQTNYFGIHEKAPVGRGGGDRAIVVLVTGPNAIRWDSSDWLCGNSDKRRKNFSPSERNCSHLVGRGSEPQRSRNWLWNGTSQFVDQGGVDSRPAALVRETDRNGNGAVRGVCSGCAGRRDGRVGTEQSEFPETPTGSDGRGHLHDSDGSKT